MRHYLNVTTYANHYSWPIKKKSFPLVHTIFLVLFTSIKSHANLLTKIQCTGPKHHIKIVLNSKYSLLLSKATTHLGNVAHQHVFTQKTTISPSLCLLLHWRCSFLPKMHIRMNDFSFYCFSSKAKGKSKHQSI